MAVSAADFALVLATRGRDVCRLGRVALGAVVVTESGFGCGRLDRRFSGEDRGCDEQQAGDEEQQSSQM